MIHDRFDGQDPVIEVAHLGWQRHRASTRGDIYHVN